MISQLVPKSSGKVIYGRYEGKQRLGRWKLTIYRVQTNLQFPASNVAKSIYIKRFVSQSVRSSVRPFVSL